MKAVVLAAGRGDRLRPLTDRLPKVMLEFDGRPLLAHSLEQLRRHGLREVAINLHHLPEAIVRYFGDGERWGMRIHYSYEAELLGTAGTLRNLEAFLGREPFFLLYGDNVTDCDLSRLARFHRNRAAIATVAVCWLENPCSCGIVEIDASDRIVRYQEKPRPEDVFSHYINAGVYYFEPEIGRYLSDPPASDLSLHVLPRLLKDRAALLAYRYGGYVLKFDSFEDWEVSQNVLAERRRAGRRRKVQSVSKS